MKYKALLCDVDGTLITNEAGSLPSKAIRETIEKISNTIYVGIATGRSYSLAMPIVRSLKLSAPCIITGGAQLIDPVTKKYCRKTKSMRYMIYLKNVMFLYGLQIMTGIFLCPILWN